MKFFYFALGSLAKKKKLEAKEKKKEKKNRSKRKKKTVAKRNKNSSKKKENRRKKKAFEDPRHTKGSFHYVVFCLNYQVVYPKIEFL